jgi:hypothetical protein
MTRRCGTSRLKIQSRLMAHDPKLSSSGDSDRRNEDALSMVRLLSEIIEDSHRAANLIRILVTLFIVLTFLIATVVGLVVVLYPTLRAHSVVAIPIATSLASATLGSASGLLAANRRRRRKTRSLEKLERSFESAPHVRAMPDGNGEGVSES